MVFTENEFEKRFNFTERKNHITPSNEHGFETYGADLEYVKLPENAKYVWTVIDGDDGTVMVSGYHYVNRLHYIIMNEPYKGEQEITVIH